MKDNLINKMVNRFLGWKLPDNFSPDCGIEFDADAAKKMNPINRRYEPIGTNLFSASQADAMVRYMLEGVDIGPGAGTFGAALEHVKTGGRAARAGWNGKDMWITYGNGNTIPAEKFWNGNTRAFAESQPDRHAEVLPYLILKTADNKILMGWLASQTDILAKDWELLPPLVPA